MKLDDFIHIPFSITDTLAEACKAPSEACKAPSEAKAEAEAEAKAKSEAIISMFKLPIEHLENKAMLESHTINDLELIKTEKTDSLYKYVFNPATIFGQNTLALWSKYYTADTQFLEDSQSLLKNTSLQAVSAETQLKVDAIWKEIKTETGFAEKYSYIEWEKLKMFNNSSKVLQCLSMYNMTSPIFSFLLPIICLILPLIILKLRGNQITGEAYIELLKVVLKKHQLGQIFNISSASFEKLIYIGASCIFYAIQIYQNAMACIRFYRNMKKIHAQLFIMKDYLSATVKNMDLLAEHCQELTTYTPFIAEMKEHQQVCEHMLSEFSEITPNTVSINKIGQVGFVMKCFYQLYNNEEYHAALQYSFGLNGYLDNLNGVRENIQTKHMGQCKFKTGVTKFVEAYFPALVNENPVKNTYKLNKHLLITGPNAAGKTTVLKTTIFNIIISQQLGFGFYKKANINVYDRIHCYINIPDTSSRDSLFQAEAKRCKDILTQIEEGQGHKEMRHFCVFDELYSGTNPYEAISSACAYLNYLNKYANVNFVLTTHFMDLCRRLDKEKHIQNCHMLINTETDDFKYTYKMKKGISNIKGGVKVLKDLDYPLEIISNTQKILEHLDI